MRKTLPVLSLGLVLLASGGLRAGEVVDSLVKTENAFAAAAAAQGVKAAFLTYLAEDAVIFRPTAVAGVTWFREHPSPPITLLWHPTYAEVSAAGDLGFTTGPYEVRSPEAKSSVVGQGTFVTVWKRQAQEWRALVDFGTEGPKPAAGMAPEGAVEQATSQGRGALDAAGIAAELQNLLGFDRSLSAVSATKGAAAAWRGRFSERMHFLRQGALPLRGAEAAAAELRRVAGALTWRPEGGGVSASGDLGFTYGTTELSGATGAQKGVYLRIWERRPGTEWKAVVDALSILPPGLSKSSKS